MVVVVVEFGVGSLLEMLLDKNGGGASQAKERQLSSLKARISSLMLSLHPSLTFLTANMGSGSSSLK